MEKTPGTMPPKPLRFLSPLFSLVRSRIRPTLVYCPEGWAKNLADGGESGWNSAAVAATEKARWDSFLRNLEGTGPLGFSHEDSDLSETRNVWFHNVHVTFGYVLARAAHGKSSLSLLDYGGGLGHYYRLAKAFVPGVRIDFHCKEVGYIAREGQALNPEIRWHTDDEFLRREYDLVMINGSLQYVREWKRLLPELASVTKEYLFLTRIPVVESANTYVAVQREYGTRMLHCQFNRAELLETVAGTGLRTVREFVVGDRPYVKGAPEQPVLCGWLFLRDREKGASKP